MDNIAILVEAGIRRRFERWLAWKYLSALFHSSEAAIQKCF